MKTKLIINEVIIKNKNFYRKYKPIKYSDWSKNKSGIVISCGKDKRNSIDNKFVLKNIKKKDNCKIPIKKLSVCISDQNSHICFGNCGIGKTEGILLPTITYMLNSKDKPNLIIHKFYNDIYKLLNSEIVKNEYNVVNLCTDNKYQYIDDNTSIYWNFFDYIIEEHKNLISNKNDSKKVNKYRESLIDKIEDIINCLKSCYYDLYWVDGGIEIIKFIIWTILWKIENNETSYETLNFCTINKCFCTINEKTIYENISNLKNEFLNEINNGKSNLSSSIAMNYLSWSKEVYFNIYMFTEYAKEMINRVDKISRTLINNNKLKFNQFIKQNKPFIIFLGNENKEIMEFLLNLIKSKIKYHKNIDNKFSKKTIWWLLDDAESINKMDLLEEIIKFGRETNDFVLAIFKSINSMKINHGDKLNNLFKRKILFNNWNDEFYLWINEICMPYKNDLEINKKMQKLNIELYKNSAIPYGYIGIINNEKSNLTISPITYFYMIELNK